MWHSRVVKFIKQKEQQLPLGQEEEEMGNYFKYKLQTQDSDDDFTNTLTATKLYT